MRVLVTAASRHGATHEIAVVVLAVCAAECDFRDWDAIDGFAAGISGHLGAG